MTKVKKEVAFTPETSEHKVELTDKQLEILQGIAQKKSYLETNYKEVLREEENILITILESAKIEAKQGIRIDGKTLYIPK